MVKKAVAKRYAKALFEMRRAEPSELGPSLEGLKKIAEQFKTHAAFRHLLLSPRFDRETKIRVFQAILRRAGAGPQVADFLVHLVRRNRFQLIGEISQAFEGLVDDFNRVVTVPVRTAREPSAEDRQGLQQRIESVLGRKVRVRWAVDDALIGGIVLRIGDAVVDGSIRGQLEALRKRLAEA